MTATPPYLLYEEYFISILETSVLRCCRVETLPSRTSDLNMLLRKLASSTPGRYSYPVTVSVNKCKQMFMGNTLNVHLHDTKKSIVPDFSSWIRYQSWNHMDGSPRGTSPQITQARVHLRTNIHTHVHTLPDRGDWGLLAFSLAEGADIIEHLLCLRLAGRYLNHIIFIMVSLQL